MSQVGGWYPDPGTCWENRWWDGAAWTEQVCTGTYVTTDAVPSATVAPTDRDQAVFELTGSKTGYDPNRWVVTWNAVQLWREKDAAPHEVVPLWMVQSIKIAGNGSKPDLRLHVGYNGYVGPAIRRLADVENADWAKAMIWRQRGLAALAP